MTPSDLDAIEKAKEKVIAMAREVSLNDGEDLGWRLRYALRDYDALLLSEIDRLNGEKK